MTSTEIKVLVDRANESHQAAKLLLDKGFPNFSAAQSYYTMFYLAAALLYSKGFEFSSHSAVIAAYGKEFAKTQALDPEFHRHLIIVERRRAIDHMARRTVCQMKTRLNHSSGPKNLCRLPGITWITCPEDRAKYGKR